MNTDHVSTQQELIEARVEEIMAVDQHPMETDEWLAIMVEMEARWVN